MPFPARILLLTIAAVLNSCSGPARNDQTSQGASTSDNSTAGSTYQAQTGNDSSDAPLGSEDGTFSAHGNVYTCETHSVDEVSRDERVLVLDDGNRYLIPDAYQPETSTWEGDDVRYCDGGQGHRFFVNLSDDEHVPVGALDE